MIQQFRDVMFLSSFIAFPSLVLAYDQVIVVLWNSYGFKFYHLGTWKEKKE